MEVAGTFIPTAGVVGFLPMLTYFFLVVTLFVFIANFVFALATLPSAHAEHRTAHALTSLVALVGALSYYLLQTYYQSMLSELATVTDAGDRQTLTREAYNALGQYRYIDWFIAAPLLFIQLGFQLDWRLSSPKRPLAGLLMAGVFMFFALYAGHQQLSFDNEIQTGPRVIWGLLATIDYVFILFSLNRLGKQVGEQISPTRQRTYQRMALILAIGWGVHLISYFLTVTPIDFSWIHLVLTLTDLASQVGISLLVYVASLKAREHP